MRKRSKLGMLLAAIACAGVVAPQAQAGTVIDLFNGPVQQAVANTFNGLTSDADNTPSASSLGGTRELYVERNVGSSVSLTVDTALAYDEVSPDPGTYISPNLAHITWDGGADGVLDTDGLGSGAGVDLSADTTFFIASNVDNNVDAEISIQVWDIDGDTWTESLLLADADPGSTHQHFLSFATFIANGVDFDRIGAIRMNFLTDNVSIDSFSVVPVPPAVGLGLLGMFIVGGIRRRKNKLQA